MPKKKCIYRSNSDNMCCCSTSNHHCKTVSNAICNICFHNQDTATVSDKQKVKNAIKRAIELLPSTIDNREGKEILYDALKL